MTDALPAVTAGPGPLTVLAKVSLLLMIGWMLHAALRQCHPQWRVGLWRAVTVGIPVVTVWSLSLPQWTWDLAILEPPPQATVSTGAPAGIRFTSERREEAMSLPVETPLVMPTAHEASSSARTANVDGPPAGAAESGRRISVSAALLIGWLLVTLCLLARILIQGLNVRRLVACSSPAPGVVTVAGRAAARELSLHARIEFRVCERFASPFVAGFRRCAIFIPGRLLQEFDANQLRLVLLHELAHVRGRDVLWSLLVKVIQSLLWFHPLAWGINRAHRQSCEAVCDTLAAAADRNSYRQFLARIALWTRQTRNLAPAAALPATADITWRLRQLERGDAGQPPSSRGLAAATVFATVALACLSTAGVALSEAPPASVEQGDTSERVAESESERTDEARADADESADTPPALSATDIADLARLQGVWQPVGGDGDENASPFLMSFDGTTLSTSVPPPLAFPATFRVDADQVPKRLIVGDGDSQQTYLYRFEGDRLELSFNEDGGDPPAAFNDAVTMTLRQLISSEQLTAVRNGLAYLCQSQTDDGSFGSGDLKGRIGITALCGMALANGGALAPDDARERIDRAVDYILSHQDERGYLGGPGGMMYDHGYAVWSLASLLDRDRFRDRVQLPLRRALEVTVDAQQGNGGWGYLPSDTGRTDLSNTTVQLRTLIEAQRIGFTVPESCLTAGFECLASHQTASGAFAYMAGQGPGSFSCTAQALSVLKQMDVNDAPSNDHGWRAFDEYVDGLRQREESWFLYGNLFALDALGTISDESTHEWYRGICETLVDRQRADGSWWPDHETMNPEYGTALACLILQPRSVIER